MNIFVESSALVKRYANETGTAWIRNLTGLASGNDIVIAEIALVEVAAALNAKTRVPNGLSIRARDRAVNFFLRECRHRFILVPVDKQIIDLAVDLSQRHPLRGYDAVQLAVGLQTNHDVTVRGHSPIVFVSSDLVLLAAAQAEGLATDDPNLHPDS